jgi:hypothetical protein
MAWKKRIGQTLESRLSGENESREAGVADRHYLSVVIKSRRGIKENSLSILGTLSRRALRGFEQLTRSAELIQMLGLAPVLRPRQKTNIG